MPILGAVLAVLVTIGVTAFSTEAPEAPVRQAVEVVATKRILQIPNFKYIPVSHEAPVAPLTTKPQVRVREVVLPVSTSAPVVEVLKPQETPVSVCLGKPAGALCSFTDAGAEVAGTCLTIAWNPLTCVPH
jgi:hypothetical protein